MSSFFLLAIMRLMVQAALPIDEHVSEIVAHVRRARTAVVVAPPGAGKTTRLPPALAELGRTILLQPRRAAVPDRHSLSPQRDDRRGRARRAWRHALLSSGCTRDRSGTRATRRHRCARAAAARLARRRRAGARARAGFTAQSDPGDERG